MCCCCCFPAVYRPFIMGRFCNSLVGVDEFYPTQRIGSRCGLKWNNGSHFQGKGIGFSWGTSNELQKVMGGSLMTGRRGYWIGIWNMSEEVEGKSTKRDGGQWENETNNNEVDRKTPKGAKSQERDSGTPGKNGVNFASKEDKKVGFWKRFGRQVTRGETGLDPAIQGSRETKAGPNSKLDIQWRDLLYPTPENLLALLLTGLLALAILQVLWQLFLVAVAISLSALKYSVLAVILIVLLIVFL
eukprot:c22853_g1_i2 orf=248-979(+)